MDIQTISRSEEIYRKINAPRAVGSRAEVGSGNPGERYESIDRNSATPRRKTALPSVPARKDDEKSVAQRRLALVKSYNGMVAPSDEIDLERAFNIDKTFLQFNLESDVLTDQYAMNKMVLQKPEHIIAMYKNAQTSGPSSESSFTMYV
ncbi:MAG TPA: hypothetical protein VHO84_00730 [Syntrophorhabdaceae bacterium]|nr:hypothetical protein [Syntrophorhabdaceae bacterium]